MIQNLFSKSTEAANNCVAPVLAPSSIKDTLSRCAPSTPCSLLPSATFKTGSKSIFQDWQVNRGNLRSQLVLCFFRLTQQFHHLPSSLRWIGYFCFACYEFFVVWILGIELNYKATIGPRLRLFHGVGTVIHETATIGADVTLRHLTTIGAKRDGEKAATIEDYVDIGCHSIILGNIRVGRGATIGAGSVVLHDVLENTMVAGNPARQIISNNDRANRQDIDA